MTTGAVSRNTSGKFLTFPHRSFLTSFRGIQIMAASLVLSLLAGCESLTAELPPPTATAAPSPMPVPEPSETAATPHDENAPLKQGDVIKIGFPGIPSMDVTQAVRPDGKISVPMAGDIVIAGKTIDILTKELLALYADKLVSKEVTVSLVSSAYPVYVTGAVLRPGKIIAERRITVFDAIMEAGGFDKAKANLKAVTIVREENGQNRSYKVDLQKMFSGAPSEPFYLKPFDTVYVPEKFNWF